jgi:F420-non-reducing hydrogenase iron-sulfur subunit
MKNFEPKIVCFACSFGWGYLTDHKELESKIKNLVPVICSGKVDSTHITRAFKSGADGVLILGCPDGECHFQDGNYQTRKKVTLMQKVLGSYGIESERLKMILSMDPDGRNIPKLIELMVKDIKKLGPVHGEAESAGAKKKEAQPAAV